MDILSYILSKKNNGSNPGGSGGGSSGSTASVSFAGGGTLVNPTKTYSKLYFNTALSNEEVMALMNNLDLNLQGMANVLYGTSENEMIMAMVVVDADIYVLSQASTNTALFAINGSMIDETITFTGWNPNIDFSNGIEISGETVGTELSMDGGSISIGANNNKIIDLFSSEPIRQPINRELSGNYEGLFLKVTNNGTIDITKLIDNGKLPIGIDVQCDERLQKRVSGSYSCKYLFYNYEGDNVDYFNGIDTSNVTIWDNMFEDCFYLKRTPRLNTDNAQSMRGMFKRCRRLETIDISYYNNRQIQIAADSYTYLLSGWLSECYSLKKLIIRKFGDTRYAGGLSESDHMTGETNAMYNPNGDKDGYIYVPDDMVDTLKTTDGWSTYATQIKPLSELPEDEQ